MEDCDNRSEINSRQGALAREVYTLLCEMRKNIENTEFCENLSRVELLEYLANAEVSALRWALEMVDD